ncbi:MAG: tyrosine--tRNA ligase, partial [Deltaproteobacteria bacterium]|nr:tyrosine--tRNA ligase [Deltaproteobacteria bacterium]
MDTKSQLEIIKRGTVDFIGEERLQKLLDKGTPLRVKAGFDPTAPDLHIGHTVLIQKLKQFQDMGHHILLLIGDFTAMIGDPTGKSETRKQLSREEIVKNAETYKSQVFKVLDEEKTEVVFNNDWMGKMTASELIELASRATVARMLERDDFSKRYKGGEPISIHEFLYPLVQGYDSVVLKADIELGGTDQLFNLLVGRSLQKEVGQAPQAVLTMPILEGTDGVQKMSKSLNNYIGITESPSEIFGKVMSISDELMHRFYDLLSEASDNHIEDIKAGKVHPMEAKKALASEIVARFHGEGEAIKAKEGFENLFKKKEVPDEIEEVVIEIEGEEVPLPNAMVQCGIADSTSASRRDIKGGGVKVDEEKITDVRFTLSVGSEHLI